MKTISSGIVPRMTLFEELSLNIVRRPNYAIAMAVAPDIFEPDHALGCLEIADEVLRKPLGIATLDPSDQNYRPNYINSLDNDDFATAKGRNYHQGPEWLWPLGYFLRAMLIFDSKRRKTKAERVEMLQQLAARMEGCRHEIEKTPWAGLTELTNENGSLCPDSSPTQAWSAGCLIDLFYEAHTVDV
jgi:glycogen debranching enzyme